MENVKRLRRAAIVAKLLDIARVSGVDNGTVEQLADLLEDFQDCGDLKEWESVHIDTRKEDGRNPYICNMYRLAKHVKAFWLLIEELEAEEGKE